MNHKRFAKVGDILPAVLKSVGLDRKLKELEILRLWPAVVGPAIAEKAKAVKIENGVLFVHVEHGAWMQELLFQEKELLRKLRKEKRGVRIDKIRFGTVRS